MLSRLACLVLALVSITACGSDGIDPSGGIDDYNDVERALNQGDIDRLRSLLAAGADPDEGIQGPPLSIAVHLDDPEFTRALVEHGADVDDVDDDGWALLFGAASNGRGETVQLLLDAGADPCGVTMADDIYDMRGMRPLEVAEMRGNTEAADVLREATNRCPS